ncbi:sugar phosphate isomerase/epimerase [Aestuariibacter sp. A3R04]|uniref:sugar phosphate isomerase/epimerase family protein n=1 Tax=Aestuariibacter sp. A3R04 TaxID=2841571 RepID=UPI001C08DBE3|nr:sugar phosphate isomerase/epimerase [Aestuariibacter sp. A3R04]MBU3020734.1 sugar phosphate isomerase/epimerase [Aestuariibacter sp. A3R04]
MSEHNKTLNSLVAKTWGSKLSRRQFTKLGAISLSMMAAPNLALAQAKPELRVGLQLYTLREMMAVSVPAVLKLVAAVGYRELEFAGYFGHSPKTIRKIMEGEGLSAPSVHIPLDTFRKEGINKIIETAQEVGHKYVVIPYLTEEQRGTTIDVYKRLAEECNTWGEACRNQGLVLAYHNHDFEFMTTGGVEPYDVLLNDVEAQNMAMELDLYWAVKAGKDPLAYFAKYPGRFKLWHVKDMDKAGHFADVGTGTINFDAIFAKSKQAGVAHRFVERDKTDDKLKTIQQGYKAVYSLMAKA